MAIQVPHHTATRTAAGGRDAQVILTGARKVAGPVYRAVG
jgi:hypothetical protein